MEVEQNRINGELSSGLIENERVQKENEALKKLNVELRDAAPETLKLIAPGLRDLFGESERQDSLAVVGNFTTVSGIGFGGMGGSWPSCSDPNNYARGYSIGC